MAKSGFLSFGFDNLGHGKTAFNDTELGFIAHKNGWKYMIDDVICFAEAVKIEYPNLPYILMGHSMGSFIARLATEKSSDDMIGLIICGTAGMNPAAPLGLMITDILKCLHSEKAISPFLEAIVFGSYNKRFPEKSKYSWVSSDAKLIKKYEQDKYCTFHFTISAMHDLMMLMTNCNRNVWFKNLRKDLPVFIISGDNDPVGNYGKGVLQVYNRLIKAGHSDTEIKLYKNARHEIHNDYCAKEVLSDILNFTLSCHAVTDISNKQ